MLFRSVRGIPVWSASAVSIGTLGCPSMPAVTTAGSIAVVTGKTIVPDLIGSNFGINNQLWREWYRAKVLKIAGNTNYGVYIDPDRLPNPSKAYLIGDAAYQDSGGGIGSNLTITRGNTKVNPGVSGNQSERVDFRHGIQPQFGAQNFNLLTQYVNYNGTASMLFFDGRAA